MPATFIETGGLIVTRAADEANAFAFQNREKPTTVKLRSQQLTDLYHFFQRNKTTVPKNSKYTPDLESWGDDFQYEAGLISQHCNNCDWVSCRLKTEQHSCPKCGASHASIDSELVFCDARVSSRKRNRRGFYLYPLADNGSWSVTIYEPDLDDLLPMLYAVTGLEQIEARRKIELKNIAKSNLKDELTGDFPYINSASITSVTSHVQGQMPRTRHQGNKANPDKRDAAFVDDGKINDKASSTTHLASPLPQLLSIALLIWALVPTNPYGYYIFLRVAIFTISIYLGYKAFFESRKISPWVFRAAAIIYNPFVIVRLNREMWSFVNIVTIIILAVSISNLKIRMPSVLAIR